MHLKTAFWLHNVKSDRQFTEMLALIVETLRLIFIFKKASHVIFTLTCAVL